MRRECHRASIWVVSVFCVPQIPRLGERPVERWAGTAKFLGYGGNGHSVCLRPIFCFVLTFSIKIVEFKAPSPEV